MKSIHSLLEVALKKRASDLVIKAGSPPALKIDGRMEILDEKPLDIQDTRDLACSIVYSSTRDLLLRKTDDELSEEDPETENAESQLDALQAGHELDLVFTVPNLVRVRANLFMERGAIGSVCRIIPLNPYTIQELSLPSVLKEMGQQPQGLIIITGPTGSGKTTTMAALIEEINRSRPCNIFTIEDPVEYVFTDKKSVIHQREVGSDTQSFKSALLSVTRQTPDVIVIGEMRDVETMDVAMTAAEIGHLVITTFHTVSATATIDRIINSFPAHLHRQVSAQLAASLLCVTSQRLARRANGMGRLPAVEVMTNSPTVRKQIEDNDTSELYNSIRDGQHFGMNTINQALEKLFQSKQINYEEAILLSGNPAELKHMLRHT
jgi:twitching motility protein PilT